jgi:hypothetical protein
MDFLYPIRPNQRKKVCISVGSVCTFYELKVQNASNHSIFQKTVFLTFVINLLPFQIFMPDICMVVKITGRLCYIYFFYLRWVFWDYFSTILLSYKIRHTELQVLSQYCGSQSKTDISIKLHKLGYCPLAVLYSPRNSITIFLSNFRMLL